MKDKTITVIKVVIPPDSKYEVIYQNRLKQIKEDFPDLTVFIEK